MSILSGVIKDGVAALADSADKIIKDFKLDPTVEAQLTEKFKEAFMSHEENMEKMSNDALATVNTTMQTEAKSEHWLQWAWRPLVGLCFVATILNNYILMPYFGKNVMPIAIPSDVWNTMMIVLGVAAATRGGDKNLLPDINFTKK